MNKLIVSWFVWFFFSTLIQMIFQGGGGLVSTTLTQSLSATDNGSIYVANTQGFRGSDTVYIEGEQILYANKTTVAPYRLYNLTRSYNHTKSSAHSAGVPVYSQELGTMNDASGAITSQTETTGGVSAANGFNLDFLVRALPQVTRSQYPYFTGLLSYFGMFLQMVGVGLTVSIIFGGIYAFMSIFKR